MKTYGITTDYDYAETHHRERINIWSGPFYSVWEAVGYSLPDNAGYMLTTYNGDKVRVPCGCPRNDDNWQAVDDAVGEALARHYKTRGMCPGPIPTPEPLT